MIALYSLARLVLCWDILGVFGVSVVSGQNNFTLTVMKLVKDDIQVGFCVVGSCMAVMMPPWPHLSLTISLLALDQPRQYVVETT